MYLQVFMLLSIKAFLVSTEITWRNACFQTMAWVKYAVFISVPGKMNKQIVKEAKERWIT